MPCTTYLTTLAQVHGNHQHTAIKPMAKQGQHLAQQAVHAGRLGKWYGSAWHAHCTFEKVAMLTQLST